VTSRYLISKSEISRWQSFSWRLRASYCYVLRMRHWIVRNIVLLGCHA
jgi:hypothetical protein